MSATSAMPSSVARSSVPLAGNVPKSATATKPLLLPVSGCLTDDSVRAVSANPTGRASAEAAILHQREARLSFRGHRFPARRGAGEQIEVDRLGGLDDPVPGVVLLGVRLVRRLDEPLDRDELVAIVFGRRVDEHTWVS